ncbi:hypothetical protein [Levilactobacillus namurensis]|uniref:hypothetical protein n=1 Tax=Levilactobacillus namurensis TaxID=380393 RepID=UPI0026EA0B3C|nr:hypothetical protein [Levilactobacillus namurensis]
MKTKEFKQEIAGMGLHLSKMRGGCGEKYYEVYVGGVMSARVSREIPGRVITLPALLDLTPPLRRQLLGIMLDYTETPIDDREEHRWNVIIGLTQGAIDYCQLYAKYPNNEVLWVDTTINDQACLASSKYVFTDEEFDRLISRLKQSPDGDRLAKIAELGKVPAPEVGE